MTEEYTLRDVAAYVHRRSSPEEVREAVVDRGQEISVPRLQCLMQFVISELNEQGIQLQFDLQAEGLPAALRLLEVFAADYRRSEHVQQLAALMASVHVLAGKAVDAIRAADLAVQAAIDGTRYSVAHMLGAGARGSGDVIFLKKPV